MGIIDKFKKTTGADGDYEDIYDNDYYDGFDDYAEPTDGSQTQNVNLGDNGFTSAASNTSFGAQASAFAAASGISLSGNAIEVRVVKPVSFECVTQIADHLVRKRTVILNLEKANKETARRLVDFLSGVAYSIEGSLTQVASNAYIITPANVDVGDAQLRSKPAQENRNVQAPSEETEDSGFGEL